MVFLYENEKKKKLNPNKENLNLNNFVNII